jgi:hypothetical protein
MIIYERNDCFTMVKQHDHALVSGELAQHWKDDYFFGLEKKNEVVLAVREHDRGWIHLDSTPLWNEKNQRPYSFEDYPYDPKITSYKNGIDEVEKMNKYAGLLCSLHFSSFVHENNDPICSRFMKNEKIRQQRLLTEIGIEEASEQEKIMFYHLKILKFCDNLSLYICLNEPGTNKSIEHPFFRYGFPQTFPFANNQLIHAHWDHEDTVSLSASPLMMELQVTLPIKVIKKELINEIGLVQAYNLAPFETRKVTYV